MHSVLIQLLRDHLNHSPTAPFDTDWGELYTLSQRHEVTAIVYAQCKRFIPEKDVQRFMQAHSTALFYFANRMSVMKRIETVLSDMEHFTIKGASVAQYYPVPAFRTMGDTDIVIHTEDRAEADKRLRELGLNCVSSFRDREWQYFYKNMEFELHDHLVYSESVNIDAQERYFNDFWKHVKENKLDGNFHFLFLILHLRKHFMNSGVGFRQFMDIAVLCSKGPRFDWIWIEDELKKLNLWTFAEHIFALNEYWFGISPPLAIDAPTPGFFASATELILKNGIFGFNNEENRNNAAVNAVRGEENHKRAMLKVAARKLFPGYQTMITVPHYAYLCGRPYLLPIAWMHRMGRSMMRKRVKKDLQTVIEGSFVNREVINHREEVYRQWGL